MQPASCHGCHVHTVTSPAALRSRLQALAFELPGPDLGSPVQDKLGTNTSVYTFSGVCRGHCSFMPPRTHSKVPRLHTVSSAKLAAHN